MFGYVFSVLERETSGVQIPHICGGHAWLINSLRFRSESWEPKPKFSREMRQRTTWKCSLPVTGPSSLARRVYFTRTRTLEDRLSAMRWRHSSPTIVVWVRFWTSLVLMWIEFVGSLLPQERFLLWHCCFPPPLKLTFDWNVNEIVVINRVNDACWPP